MDPHERACFYAHAKSAGEKIAFYSALIDFDTTLEHEQKIVSPVAHNLVGKEDRKEEMRPLEESLERLHDVVGGENRKFDTVKITRNRIAWYGEIETAMVIITAVAQVWIIQTVFTESAKPRV
ncbi:hypothetical protein HKX48_001646 [Thoreauomyces humboldtii]|nr:hypothetical protein HKX48_001646 [Thoreauomyces humboldtii]